MLKPFWKVLPMLVAAMLALGACGGAESEDAGEPGEAVSDDTGSNLTDLGAVTDSDCRQYIQAFGESPNITNPGSLDSIDQVAGLLESAAEKVPNEIRDDFRTVAGAYRSFADALGGTDVDLTDPSSMAAMSADDLAALQAASGQMGSAEVTAALDDIDAFLSENCT